VENEDYERYYSVEIKLNLFKAKLATRHTQTLLLGGSSLKVRSCLCVPTGAGTALALNAHVMAALDYS
jgi:hypothetical protein